MQFARFLLVGGLNTTVGLGCIYGAMWLFGLDYRLANAFGYAAGSLLSFLLNRRWTFAYSGSLWASGVRWYVVVALCFLLNLLTIVGLHEGLHVGASLAQIGGVAVYTGASFVGARFYAFGADRSDQTSQVS